ncbi:hypothetical protein H310_03698 [Aphanomyces invadans]|uniref:Uncharacterized protein n=1 Tax=Aphanomyces invadans TaxID=157072 RepID=A0A024UIT6_9STRA|nr:hypothetical protein H310_03698 [Aphanomyces invadans]ETW06105.1 hypothetical protein H310_03698 [Aphanomyces invadans]|eukprot:XP_008865882.1 hypothetical protein H310_03698 [Aphanomyces invadans]
MHHVAACYARGRPCGQGAVVAPRPPGTRVAPSPLEKPRRSPVDAAKKYASKKVNQAANRVVGPLNKAVYTAKATKHLAGAAASVMNAGARAGNWIQKKADKRGNNAFVRAVGRAAGNGAAHMEVGRDRARQAQAVAAFAEAGAKRARDLARGARDGANNMIGRG